MTVNQVLHCSRIFLDACSAINSASSRASWLKETWLVCQDCGRKYPIRDDIPVMLIDEGDKWIETKVEDLPIPPPEN